MSAEAAKVVAHVNSLGLTIPPRAASHEHVGAIIADAVLQVGHGYKTHVRRRITRILESYPNANTLLGLFQLLKETRVETFLRWKGKDEQDRFLQSAKFFQNEKINTFDDLQMWLKSETNRDRLISNSARHDNAGIPRISDATADYYRVLVRLPDVVKVDSRVKGFLKAARVNTRGYEYKDLRKIVQLAASQLGKPPIDLEGAIWNYQANLAKEVAPKDMGTYTANELIGRDWMKYYMNLCEANNLMNELKKIERMERPPTWNLKREGPGGKPDWWFRRAVRDNLQYLLRSKQIGFASQKNEPSKKDKDGVEALSVYLGTSEGKAWVKANPQWSLPQPPTSSARPTAPDGPPPHSIMLSSDEQARLDDMARTSGIPQSTLLRALIAWHLR